MSDRIVTISLGEDYIRIAEGILSGEQLEITALGESESPYPIFDITTDRVIDGESKEITKLFDSLKLKTKNVNVVIPDSVTYSQILEMPKLKEKELLSAIKYQADQFIPMPLEDTALDLEILREDLITKKLLVLIVATPQILVNKIESLIELSGLIPDSIENELSASISFLSTFYRPVNDNEGTLFINFGPFSTSLYFFHHAQKMIVESHTFKLGFNLFSKEIQSNLNYDDKKTREVLKTVGFGQGEASLDQVLKPVLGELLKEIGKFATSIKEKYKITGFSQLFLHNIADEILYLDKKLEASLTIATHLFDPGVHLKQSPLTQSFAPRLSSFVATLGGCIR